MSGYTIKNLKDVQDSAPKFGMQGVEARFASGDLELEKSGLSYQRLDPGVRIPFGHTQKQQEEVYVVLGGSGRVKLDDEIVDIGAHDVVRVDSSVMRGFEGGPDGVEILAFGAPHTGPGDAEMQQDWWTD